MSNISSGLVSVTFRQLSPPELVNLVVQAGLEGIEWGGDVHVPHGNVVHAREVRAMTLDAGLSVAAYGSYYRAGHDDTGPFGSVLESAVALGAPCIRVWAGHQGADQADDDYWAAVVADSRRIADLAGEVDLPIVYEFHRNTLTDSNEAARLLLERVGHANVRCYWQPPSGATLDTNLAGIEAIAPWLYGLHVFSWHEISGERLPLAHRAANWQQVLHKAAELDRAMYALIEFVRDDLPQNFLSDAIVLKRWLVAVPSSGALTTGENNT